MNIRADNTLLIFDEVQEVPKALTVLKCFYGNAPYLAVIAAGSLLGVALHQDVSFPVDKVEFLPMYPMDFGEFLLAMDEKPLYDLLQSQDWTLITALKTKYIDRLRQYYFVGGMPEAVQTFAYMQDVQAVRTVQQNLLLAYEYDFSKHIDDPRLVMRVRALWNTLPQQLSKEKNSCWRIYKKARASKITNSPYNGSKTAGWFTPCTASKNRIYRCRAIRKTSSNYTAWTWVCSAQKPARPDHPA